MIFLLLILLQIAVFGALIIILQNVLKRHFGDATTHLDAMSQDSEKRLNDAKNKTEEANVYYDDMIAKAKADAEQVKQQLIDEGLKEKQSLVERARKESEEIMDRARSARQLLEESWQREIGEKARDVSLKALQAILPSKIGQDLQSEWIENLLKSGFENLNRLNVPKDLNKAKIVSAMPLKDEQKKAILSKLSEKIGWMIEIEERIDERLILGFRLTLGSVVIDGSLAWQIKETLQRLGAKEHG